MSIFLRSFAAVIAASALCSVALGMSGLGVGAAPSITSHSAKPAATLIAAADRSPDSTFYDQ